MSAFSDWNGPGCGTGGAAALPQIRTLEELLQRIDTLDTAIQNVRTALDSHADTTGATIHGVLATATGAIATSLIPINSTIAGYSASSTIKSAVDAIATTVASLGTTYAAILAGYTSAATVKTDVNSVRTALATATGTISVLQATLAGYTSAGSVKLAVDDAKAAATALADVAANVYTIKVGINTLKDAIVGQLTVRDVIDYGRLFKSQPPLRPVSNKTYMVAILGCLSPDYITDGGYAPPTDEARHKSGTAFVKYTDSLPFNAVIDMSVTLLKSAPSTPLGARAISGSISATVSKTDDREPYAIDPTSKAALRFGLYTSTTAASSKKIVYLGVTGAELSSIPTEYKSGEPSLFKTGFQTFQVGGINFLPNGLVDYPPEGAVTEITFVDVSESDAFATTHIDAKSIQADEYRNIAGESIWKETVNPNTGLPELSFGDTSTHLVLNSLGRPSVAIEDGSRHDIAYLSDLAQSIYWQQAVAIVTDNWDELDKALVTVDASDKPITWNAAGNNKPGIYTSDKTSSTPTGILFNNGDVALIKHAGSLYTGSPVKAADGMLNDTFPNSLGTYNYNFNQVTNVSASDIRYGSQQSPAVSTTLRTLDVIETYVVIATNPNNGTFTAEKLTNGLNDCFAYELPYYATFTGGVWTKAANPIDLPQTYDHYVHDVTYEWSGMHITADTTHYISSYIMWTAHHQNNVTMKYAMSDWAYTDLILDMYRTAANQDRIDHELAMFSLKQSDYTENEGMLMAVKLPNQTEALNVPNPAYINNRPWTGVAVLDGGTFTAPLMYPGWIVDGGDFTGINGQIDASLIPAVPSSNQFRNVIQRVLHGNEADQPDQADPNAKLMFAHTLRWLDDLNAMFYSDGTTIRQIGIPPAPTTDATYTLQCVVTAGVPTFSWV